MQMKVSWFLAPWISRCRMALIQCGVIGIGLIGIELISFNPVHADPSPLPQIDPQLKQLPPAPPSTPPPNRTRSGGSLSEQAMCGTGTQSLRALVPVENPVLTTETHPTFWFYVPYGSNQVQQGDFSVLVGLDEMRRLYRTRFTLPAQPGIVSIRLPDLPQYALEEKTFYHWYFKLTCQNNATEQVDGWVQRVAVTPERQQQIQAASTAVWYDALTLTAEQLAVDPSSAAAQTQWQTLLNAIGAEDLAEQPIIGTVQIEENTP
jgi:Domain of Unknown Function (DUF928)